MNEPIRPVEHRDLAAVAGLVHDLARYQRGAELCTLTVAQLEEALFGPRPAVFGHVAEVEGDVVGCAIWFLNFSTWRGVHGIYLEDLFVKPEFRVQGLGGALLATLARECTRRGYARLEWSVLNWNEHAIGFYRSLGAHPLGDQTTFRLDGEPLSRLAGA